MAMRASWDIPAANGRYQACQWQHNALPLKIIARTCRRVTKSLQSRTSLSVVPNHQPSNQPTSTIETRNVLDFSYGIFKKKVFGASLAPTPPPSIPPNTTIFQKSIDNSNDTFSKTPDFLRSIDAEHLCASWTTSSFLEISKRRHASFPCY